MIFVNILLMLNILSLVVCDVDLFKLQTKPTKLTEMLTGERFLTQKTLDKKILVSRFKRSHDFMTAPFSVILILTYGEFLQGGELRTSSPRIVVTTTSMRISNLNSSKPETTVSECQRGIEVKQRCLLKHGFNRSHMHPVTVRLKQCYPLTVL